MLRQKRAKLLLETDLPVVRFLILNVPRHLIEV